MIEKRLIPFRKLKEICKNRPNTCNVCEKDPPTKENYYGGKDFGGDCNRKNCPIWKYLK